MIRKIVFLTFFFLLTAANSWLAKKDAAIPQQVVTIMRDDYAGTETPLGEGEEKSGEEDKDVSEEDDSGSLDHNWLSREKSSDTDLHILYQEILFKDLEIEIVIPPPRA
ncbi:MAG TPA: hypothetical protein VFE50_13060 [Cyclobacteriaceae bacterium]|nr:hypothetical protein [Cyclobacteriaceae bacterium]